MSRFEGGLHWFEVLAMRGHSAVIRNKVGYWLKARLARNRRVRCVVWATLGMYLFVYAVRFAYFELSELRMAGWAKLDADGIRFGPTRLVVDFSAGDRATTWFSHTRWQGSPEEFARGHEYHLQLPRGVLNIGLMYAPLEAVRERMPESVPDLARLLRSSKPIEVYCPAEALAREGVAILALPVVLEAAEHHGSLVSLVQTISRGAGGEAVPALIKALSTTNEWLRSEIVGVAGSGNKCASGSSAIEQVSDWRFGIGTCSRARCSVSQLAGVLLCREF